MDLLTSSSPGDLPTLSLTTNSSWLPWGRVAMPLISPLMPVPTMKQYTKPRKSCTLFSLGFVEMIPSPSLGFLRGVFLANHLASNDNLTRTTKRQKTCQHKLTIHKNGPNKLCGRPPQYAPAPYKLTVDLSTFKVVSESRVTWATPVPILVFLGLSVLDLGPMYATDRR